MKVKIKKEGKSKNYKLIDSWSDVNMGDWLTLINFKEGSKAKEAEETIAALSDMPKQVIKSLSLKDVVTLTSAVAKLQAEQDTILKKIFEIDGVEYGMHPDLSEITLGEYADIETLMKEGIEDNMPELMAILFRPVIEKEGDAYVIEAYDGVIKIRAELMKKMSSVQVQSALVFFWHIGTVFWKVLPLCLTERTQAAITQAQTEILQSVGDGLE